MYIVYVGLEEILTTSTAPKLLVPAFPCFCFERRKTKAVERIETNGKRPSAA